MESELVVKGPESLDYCDFYDPWDNHGLSIKECIEYDAKDCLCREPLSPYGDGRCPWWGYPGYDVEPRT